MKAIEVVAAIIHKEDKIFATQRDMVILRTTGSSLAEKWKLEKHRRRL